MGDWLTHNWLAFYGALVGTIALVLNFVRYRHTVRSGQVRLAVTFEKAPKHSENLREMQESESCDDWKRRNLFEFYIVIVRNIGDVEAHIQNVGIITDRNERKNALKSRTESDNILYSISDLPNEVIARKSSAKYIVYLRRGEEPFSARKAFVKDKTDKEWRSST